MNIQEASIYSGRSEKTLRRWIHNWKYGKKGTTLPTTEIEGRYDILAGDLDAVLVHQPAPADTLSTRISALEDRVSVLEHLVTQLTTNLPSRRSTAPRATYEHRTASEKSATLPGDLVAASIFGELHGIAHSTTHKAIESGRLAAIEGNWKVGRAIVKHALDAAGQAQFVRLYRSNPHFRYCEECSHDEA